MDPNMYTAAMKNQVDDLNRYSADQFALQVTPNGNTLLHVAAQFNSYRCVPAILSKCPSLLHRANTNGDTPIHVAAAQLKFNVVVWLINFAKSAEGSGAAAVREMWGARNHDGDTPLHLAAKYDERGFFLEKLFMEEDPGFDHGPNKAGETPLYLFVDRGDEGKFFVEVLSQMLKTHTPPEYGGPDGKTALHTAVIRCKHKFIDILIEWKEDLIKEPDGYGRTPLHYAAENGDVEAVKKLLDKDESVAYITENNDKGNTALHMATAKGHTKVMEEILSKCPDCWEMVNSKGQNILHISADLERDEATKFISKQPWKYGLVNQKDHKGSTPMHVLAHNYKIYKGKQNLFLLFLEWGVDIEALNNEGLTPYDILFRKMRGKNWLHRMKFLRQSKDEKDQGDNWKTTQEEPTGKGKQNGGDQDRKSKMAGPDEAFKMLTALFRKKETQETEQREAEDTGKMTNTHMIVATLIATISFAAGFTIPGGHRDQGPNQGTAVLVREAAFKAFVITNTIAVVCSTSSVFLYVSASLFDIRGQERKSRAHRHAIAFWLTTIAMLAMMLAYITGAYAVLAHSVRLAIVTCVIACPPFFVCAFDLKKHFAEEIADAKESLSYFWEDFTESLSDFWEDFTEDPSDFCRKCISSVCKVARLKGREQRRGA